MQSWLASHVETLTQMAVGLAVAVGAYKLLLPLLGYEIDLVSALTLAGLMFPLNYGRQLVIRRLFNR